MHRTMFFDYRKSEPISRALDSEQGFDLAYAFLDKAENIGDGKAGQTAAEPAFMKK